MLPDLDALSLPQQVAQLIVVRASGYLFDHQIKYPQWEAPNAKLQYWLQDLGVGGVILLGGSAGELALRSQQMQSWAKIPLLLAADVEEGAGQRFTGATWFPPPMALSEIYRQDRDRALLYAEQMGAAIAAESLAIGLNWLLAPVVDVNNNPDNPVINIRAFGENPAEVSELTAAFIQGARQYPVLTAAKHFPGHGDTAADSHLELPVLPHDEARLAAIELPPFAAAIAAGTDAVMTAHLLIPAWDRDRPATLSPAILTQQLRQKLGFSGLIVTDALVMGAIANHYGANEAAVMALEAGADILLMPADPEGAIAAIVAAVESGRIAPAWVRAAVERVWQAKQRVFASPTPAVPLWEAIARPEFLAANENILRHSLRQQGQLPLSPPDGHWHNAIAVDDILDVKFLDRHSPAITLPQQLGSELHLIDRRTYPQGDVNFDECSFNLFPTSEAIANTVLLQLFIRGNPFRGSASLNQIAENLFKQLLKTDRLMALAVYGSPYVCDRLLTIMPPHIPAVFTCGQTPSAQKIALEALFGAAFSLVKD